ncbi:MAG: class I SAM-dependent rRNA methyltransferase [bacterium]
MTLELHLKPGREFPIIRGHPWIMSGAISRMAGNRDLDEANIIASNGSFIGRGTVHPSSEIRARIFSTCENDHLDATGIHHRLEVALERRQRWLPWGLDTAARLVFSESDGLPGLIVDRYADVLVIQLLTAPWEARREVLIESLKKLLHPKTIWERSDVDVRRHEGLEPRKMLLYGPPLATPTPFNEGGMRFLADVENGHKTGFYLDQRSNRQTLRHWVGQLGRPRVLNVFAYSDSFGASALQAGAASVLSLDSSTSAQELADRQLALNPECDPAKRTYRVGDAFELLRGLREDKARFDLIILDPPKLVNGKAKMQKGLRAYKDINLLACQLLDAGGLLFSFSCSGLVDRELFGKVIEGAARDARRPAQFLADLDQPPDHPRKPGFPESGYLKGFVVGV